MPIVPVAMQREYEVPDGFSGPLGELIPVGAVCTTLSEPAVFDAGIDQLSYQVQCVRCVRVHVYAWLTTPSRAALGRGVYAIGLVAMPPLSMMLSMHDAQHA